MDIKKKMDIIKKEFLLRNFIVFWFVYCLIWAFSDKSQLSEKINQIIDYIHHLLVFIDRNFLFCVFLGFAIYLLLVLLAILFERKRLLLLYKKLVCFFEEEKFDNEIKIKGKDVFYFLILLPFLVLSISLFLLVVLLLTFEGFLIFLKQGLFAITIILTLVAISYYIIKYWNKPIIILNKDSNKN